MTSPQQSNPTVFATSTDLNKKFAEVSAALDKRMDELVDRHDVETRAGLTRRYAWLLVNNVGLDPWTAQGVANHTFPSPIRDVARPRYAGRGDTLAAVAAERGHQHDKHGSHAPDSAAMSNTARLAVLVEEVGEVAHLLTHDADGDLDALREEMTQVAAVALGWLDHLHRVLSP